MLQLAMDSFQVLKQKHKENEKGQYTDKLAQGGGKKEYFRASELGSGDRKIIYNFFAHQLPKKSKSAQNLRQLENGDYVHDRYQTAWEAMGVLISMEQRLSSKDDEYLSQLPWEWAGHYDGELDINLLRAFALGKAEVHSVLNEETGQYEVEVEIDEAYANSIGLFDENGNIAEDYEPLRMVADIKTMSPYMFKKIRDKNDVGDIHGYIDQLSFYMYMLNTPYGSIFAENKENNETLEIQVLWKDMHTDENGDPINYEFTEAIHGLKLPNVIRVTIDNARFFGSDTEEGCVPRISRLHEIKVALDEAMDAMEAAREAGDFAGVLEAQERIAKLMVPRCSDTPDRFPCSWGHRNGNVQHCEFYEHCWHPQHQGLAITPYEECPPEAIWEFEQEEGEGEDVVLTIVRIDSRKVPEGIDQTGFLKLVEMGALDYTQFLVDVSPELVDLDEARESAVNVDHLFNPDGSLKLGGNSPAPAEGGVSNASAGGNEAVEYVTDGGEKAIDCVNCKRQVTYKKLGAGNVKKCTHCGHTNPVLRP